MLRDNAKVQDLVLVVARWLLLGALVLANLEAEDPVVPLPVLVGLGLYALFLTIAFVGAWAGTRLFAYFQSVGDLAVVAATLTLSPNILGRAYVALLIVAAIIGLRRLPWLPTLGLAGLATVVGLLAERGGLGVLPYGLEALLPGVLVLVARLLAGDPLPPDLLERRPPVSTDQVRALQALGKTLGDRSELQPLLQEAHRVITAHTGATRAAIVLLDESDNAGHAYAFVKNEAQVKPVTVQATGAAPHERVLREGRLRLNRQREPLPVLDVVDGRGATSFLGVPLRANGDTLGALIAYDKDGGRPFPEQDETFLELVATALAATLLGGQSATEAAESADVFSRGLVAMLAQRRPEQDTHAEQVARFAVAIAEELELPAEEQTQLRLGARLHDVGELAAAEPIAPTAPCGRCGRRCKRWWTTRARSSTPRWSRRCWRWWRATARAGWPPRRSA